MGTSTSSRKSQAAGLGQQLNSPLLGLGTCRSQSCISGIDVCGV